MLKDRTKENPAGNIFEELNSQKAMIENAAQAPDFTFTVGCSTLWTILCC